MNYDSLKRSRGSVNYYESDSDTDKKNGTKVEETSVEEMEATVPPELSEEYNDGDAPKIEKNEVTKRPYKKRRKKYSKKLPLELGPSLTILAIGVIKYPNHAQEKYTLPIGFKSERQYTSYIKGDGSRTTYLNEILDGDDGPMFRVTASDDTQHEFLCSSMSACWTKVIKRVNEVMKNRPTTSASGPQLFGINHPEVVRLIQAAPKEVDADGLDLLTGLHEDLDMNASEEEEDDTRAQNLLLLSSFSNLPDKIEKEKHIVDPSKFIVRPKEMSDMTDDGLRKVRETLEASLRAVETVVQMKKNGSCPMCNEKHRNMLFIPCRHNSCCSACGETVQECPVCNTSVTDRIEINFC
jgi:hypothetical protein